MHNRKKYLIATILVLGALVFSPALIPMGAYIGKVEKAASEKLGVPVSIKSLHVALLPSPRLNISGLGIGKDDEVVIEDVAVVPAILSLVSETKTISSIQITQPVVKKTALDILAGLGKAETPSAATVGVRRIVVRNATFLWPGLELPAMNADIAMDTDNQPESAKVESVDGKFRGNMAAKGDQYSITLEAKRWEVPAGPPLMIDRLYSEMSLHGKRLEISRIDADMYRGRIDGNAELAWEKGWNLAGRFKVNGLSVHEPASLMSKSARISGNLYGNGSFNAKAGEPARLAEHLAVNFRFDVKNGVLYGFDLSKAPLMLLGKGQGGETRFDVFSGVLNARGRQYHLRDLKASSGLFAATGAVRINAGKELNGVVNVEAKHSAAMAEIPLQVSGTVDHPMVLPTKAAIAGAVAGTTILGPGTGTSLGVKAGSALDKVKGLLGGN